MLVGVERMKEREKKTFKKKLANDGKWVQDNDEGKDECERQRENE